MSEIIYQGILIVVAESDTKNGFRVDEAIVRANGERLPLDLYRFSGGKEVRQGKLNRGARNGTKTAEIYRRIQA